MAFQGPGTTQRNQIVEPPTDAINSTRETEYTVITMKEECAHYTTDPFDKLISGRDEHSHTFFYPISNPETAFSENYGELIQNQEIIVGQMHEIV